MSGAVPVFRVRAVRTGARAVRLRLPFRFGDTRVEATHEAFLALEVAGPGGAVVRGHAAQLMVPRWFDKRAHLTNEATVAELGRSVAAAAEAAPGLAGSVAEIAADLRAAVRAALPPEVPALAAGFGPALAEMALIDAACLAAGLAFPDAARRDLFGLGARDRADIPGAAVRAHLAALPRAWRIGLRHTVGYDAPLVPGEVAERPADGLPVALTEVIAATGIRWFKLKLKGVPEADIARLRAIAAVLDGLEAYGVTLDANEQYAPEEFAAFCGALAGTEALARLAARVAFVEQPFAREIALGTDLRLPDGAPPLVIDESDAEDAAFPAALARGYAGVSAKSCKGVLRALLNAARVAELRRAGRPGFLSAEDLTCQPGLCWQQDTLMAATVGATHAERNGHHFAGGLQGAPEAERAAFLAAHPDIYTAGERGPELRIAAGEVVFASLDRPGFAAHPVPDFDHMDPIPTLEEYPR